MSGKHILSGRAFLPGAVLAILAIASSARAQDRVIGLLSLPEVFGARQCAPFEPEQVALHEAPKDAKAFAFIRVDQNWSFAPHGGCEGLRVSVHEGSQRYELPTLEFDYEMPGAIVLEQRNRWFKVRLASGSGWIDASPVDRFMPLSELFEEFVGVTAITTSFNGRLVMAPGRAADPSGVRVIATQPARVIEIRSVFGQSWVQVEVMDHSICTAADNGPPDIVATGWMPLHAADGEPTIWFSSRGC
jgi:hypothetical protein